MVKHMLAKKDKEKAIELLKEGKITDLLTYVPQVADEIIINAEKRHKLISTFDETFPDYNSHCDAIPPSVFLTLGSIARLKNFQSMASFPLATTNPFLLERLNFAIHTGKEGLFNEKNVRNFSKKYKDDSFVKYTDEFFIKLYDNTTFRNMHNFSYDCSEIPVNLKNDRYEHSSVITGKKGERIRGYKLGILRGQLPHGGGYPCQIVFGQLKTHDLNLSKNALIGSPWLRKGDNLNIDRGFLDHQLMRALNDKGVSTTVPAKKNMEIYKEAVTIAIKENNWSVHPNPKRKKQKIQLVKDLAPFYRGDPAKEKDYQKEMKIHAAVVRIELKSNKDAETEDLIISADKKYAYAVILCTNASLTAREIIENYETRWGCEEDYRQLKGFWKLNAFTTTRYEGILLEMICCIIAYALCELYKETPKGEKYRNHCLMKYIEYDKQLFKMSELGCILVVPHYYAVLQMKEIMKLYRYCDEKTCKLLDKKIDC